MLCAGAACLLLFNYVRPLPLGVMDGSGLATAAQPVQLTWPAAGSAAVGAVGFGTLAEHGDAQPRPTASTAKLITALAILEKHPLQLGQQGPAITIKKADVDLYNKYYGEGGSVVKVAAGERISEYQALEAMLLPSANNMADTGAAWAFGSVPAYISYANGMAQRLSLQHTTVAGDASGMLPDTKSTPGDLVQLGERALSQPVIAQIIAKPAATIPVAGVIQSATARLGLTSVIDIKTGLTDQAGGCFVFAAKHTVGGKPVTVVGALMGEPSLWAAFADAPALANSAKANFALATPVHAGQTLNSFTTPWRATASVIAKNDVSIAAWKGQTLAPRLAFQPFNRRLASGSAVGTLSFTAGGTTASTSIVAQNAIASPSTVWRFTRLPF